MKKHASPNDQRSNAKNPNNPAYEADQANRVRQGLPDALPEPQPEPQPPTQPPAKKG
jgi:hypothetical protein